MYKRLDEESSNSLQEQYFGDSLFCTLTGIMDRISSVYDEITAVECWSTALDIKDRIVSSKRPDLTVPGVKRSLKTKFSSFEDSNGTVSDRSDEAAERSSFLVLLCVTYMLCSTERIEGTRRKIVHALMKEIIPHPLFPIVFMVQRRAEKDEEQNGNPVPVASETDFVGNRLSDACSPPYGKTAVTSLPNNLRTCIADNSLFADFVAHITGPVMEFIKSPEGSTQYWEIVRRVAQEKGYISRKCSRLRFAEVICAICPSAGKASTLAASIDKYPLNEKEAENDMRTIRCRFEL